MKKLILLVILIFGLYGCQNIDPNETEIETPSEPTATPVEPTPTPEALSMQALLDVYLNFITNEIIEIDINPTPYYPVFEFQEIITKASLIDTYETMEHQIIDLTYRNFYYLHLVMDFHNYFESCTILEDAFLCEKELFHIFYGYSLEVNRINNQLNIEIHMYQDDRGMERGHHRYYTFDIIDDRIVFEIKEIQTLKDPIDDTIETINHGYVKIIEDISFELLYLLKDFDMLIYTKRDVHNFIDISYVLDINEGASLTYYDHINQVRSVYVDNQVLDSISVVTTFYQDGKRLLRHYQTEWDHTIIYNMMHIDGWKEIRRSIDGSQVLFLITDDDTLMQTHPITLRIQSLFIDKIPLELFITAPALDEMTIDLSHLDLHFDLVTKDQIVNAYNNAYANATLILSQYHLGTFENPSLEIIDTYLDTYISDAIIHHQALS